MTFVFRCIFIQFMQSCILYIFIVYSYIRLLFVYFCSFYPIIPTFYLISLYEQPIDYA